MPGPIPSVAQRRVGMELRKLRTAAGRTLDDVAAEMEWSPSKVSRVETGQVRVLARDVRLLCKLLGAGDDVADALAELTKDARLRGWWNAYRDVLESSYIPFEAGAMEVQEWQMELVPALLQTESYVRALMRGGRFAGAEEEVERRVRVRLDRQAALDRPDSPLGLWAVISEGALHRRIGGGEVLIEQLERILTRTNMPNIDVQVLPFEAGAHPTPVTTFTILRFGSADPVVFTALLSGERPVEDPGEATRYQDVFNMLRAQAESPERSRGIIGRAAAAARKS